MQLTVSGSAEGTACIRLGGLMASDHWVVDWGDGQPDRVEVGAERLEVFTTSGRRVYRGVSTAIPVPRPGVYIITAAGRKYKVGVK